MTIEPVCNVLRLIDSALSPVLRVNEFYKSIDRAFGTITGTRNLYGAKCGCTLS